MKPDYRHFSPFAPTTPGHYVVTLNDRIYAGTTPNDKRHKQSDLNGGRVVIFVEDDLKTCVVNGGQPSSDGWITTVEKISTDFWLGPYNHTRPCFVCARPLVSCFEENDPNDKFVLSPDDGVSLGSCGHYGCTTIDSMGDEFVNILVCDTCMYKKQAEVLRYRTTTKKSIQTRSVLSVTQHSYQYDSDMYAAHEQFFVEESQLLKDRGYEFRFYKDGEITTPEKADHNESSYFLKTTPLSIPKSEIFKESHKWYTELQAELIALRAKYFSEAQHGNVLMVDEVTGAEHDERDEILGSDWAAALRAAAAARRASSKP